MEERRIRWPWWAAASSAQLAVGIAWYRRGYCGSGASMPFKAFAIATLFVGADSTAFGSALLAAGIRTVDDMKDVGTNLRRWMRRTPGEDLLFTSICLPYYTATSSKRTWGSFPSANKILLLLANALKDSVLPK